jgi:hypothetical protein
MIDNTSGKIRLDLYNAPGHKLRFPQSKKAQFVTVKGIDKRSMKWEAIGDFF